MSIDINNISKTFGRFQALKNVNLNIADGELVALLGPSGSGKTTLLRIIAGLEAADPNADSAIRFHGQDVVHKHVQDRQVGFVFQHYALFRHMTVFENVAFGLRVRPRKTRPSNSDIRSKVLQLLKLVQLENLELRYPTQLSGGQRQRVALARALAVEPRILLLDEPFGALDARVRADLRKWLRRLHDEIHVTSVFVTHDQEEALEVSDRVVVMNKGTIEQVGTPEEVFHRPANEFVMHFLGNVNLFHGRIEQGKAVFGKLILDQKGLAQATEGQAARLFVRPHELDISLSLDAEGVRAKVMRVQLAGPLVKLELEDELHQQPIQVDLPHERYRQTPVRAGDVVSVAPRGARVFVDDYSI